jgi:tRNA 5-methylaminomethyl-2-thiouridine biosynthesis bifunctional protein
LCGEIAPGLWILGGLGSRGFTTAPLLGEHLAASLLGRASPLPAGLAALVEPTRASATFVRAASGLS